LKFLTAFFAKIKRSAPSIYDEMKKWDGEPVRVFLSDETGEWLWAVASAEDDWWFDGFPTEKEANSFCKAMGWPIVVHEWKNKKL
jgi:hypothetical protein